MELGLRGKVAAITDASAGIGLAIAPPSCTDPSSSHPS
jgi:NADP-dependent 3-hydroxy acid dehydrogenase YdfG